MPFGQHQDTELWKNQFPETKILGLPVSQRMRDLVYMASRDKVDAFSSPEAALLLVSTKNRDLWPYPTPEVRDSRTSRHSAHTQNQVCQI